MAAAATTPVSLKEYLRTTYNPDLEYIDGELKERPEVMSVHGTLQSLLSSSFCQRAKEWKIRPGVGVRTQVSPDRVRLPDVVVDRAGFWPETLTRPPSLVIEILSPTDTHVETRRKMRDYLDMGIETIWIIDPETRNAEVHGKHPEAVATYLKVADSPVFLDLDEIFRTLDEYQAEPEPPTA